MAAPDSRGAAEAGPSAPGPAPKRPVRCVGSAFSASITFTSPQPADLDHDPRPEAVDSSTFISVAGVHRGCFWSSSAASPDTYGAAKLVPESTMMRPSGNSAPMPTPGAVTPT